MDSYRIVCTIQVPVNAPPTHAHIVKVGTGTDPDKYTKLWTLQEVLSAMDAGDTFFTIGIPSGHRAEVDDVSCPTCGHRIIRSAADAVSDNNLDSLRECRT